MQMTLAALARDEAIDRVDRHADPEWKLAALTTIAALPAGTVFTSDDVWTKIDQPREPRALGAVFMRAQRLGLATPLAGHVASERHECHARPLRLWKRTAA